MSRRALRARPAGSEKIPGGGTDSGALGGSPVLADGGGRPEERTDRQPPGDTAGPEPAARRSMQPLVVAAIVIAGLYFGRPVFEPLALAVLFSLMLAPLVRWLGHRV